MQLENLIQLMVERRASDLHIRPKGPAFIRMDGELVPVEGAEFWLADESPEHFNFSPESLGGGSVRIVLIVEDPDAAFERAVAAGATMVWPVDNRYSWRIGRIADPFGHHWEIGKPLSEGR